MKIVCIMQARMGSSRLPGKVLKKICDKTVLEHDIDRLKRVANIDEIIIATTTKDLDDEIVNESKRLGIKVFRGCEDDVLSRYYYAAKENKADIIVRVTSDCPLIDPNVTHNTIEYYLNNNFDYVNNTLEPTFPRGLDTEVFEFGLLERAFQETKEKIYREHVTTYFWKNPNLFSLGCYKNEIDFSEYRWTLDTEEDFLLIKKIYNSLYETNKEFVMEDITKLYQADINLSSINSDIKQKKV